CARGMNTLMKDVW
nr:immunoglobulin heavy chain junction region [Macaca mulatta]